MSAAVFLNAVVAPGPLARQDTIASTSALTLTVLCGTLAAMVPSLHGAYQ